MYFSNQMYSEESGKNWFCVFKTYMCSYVFRYVRSHHQFKFNCQIEVFRHYLS